MTPAPLDVLILEDNPVDAELMLAELRRAGFATRSQCVDRRESFLAALDPPPELILADFAMPQFDALDALEILRARGLSVPFIIVSGSIGEDQAVAAIKKGADDYLLKDRLGRLASAVKQALELKRLRREKESAEKAHARLAAIIEATTDFVGIADAHGRMLYVNRAGRRMLDVSEREEVHDLSLRDFHPDWAAEIVMRDGLAGARNAGAWTGETALLSRDGHEIPVSQLILAHKGPEGAVEFYSTIARDVTEQNRAERRLRDSEERFRELAENIREVFWVSSPDKNQVLYVSPAYESIWQRPCEQLYQSPRDWLNAIHAEDRGRVLQAALTKQTEGSYDEEYRILRPDGSVRWIHDKAFPVRTPSGEVHRVVGVAEDVTERKLTEQALRESEERYRSLVELSPDVILVSVEGSIAFVNRAGARLFRAGTAANLLGMSVLDLVHPESRDAVRDRIDRVLKGEETTAFAREKLQRLDGTVGEAELAGIPTRFHGQAAIQFVIRDITDRL